MIKKNDDAIPAETAAPAPPAELFRVDVLALEAGLTPEFFGGKPNRPNPQHWRYRVLVARTHWQPNTRVTRAEFDAAVKTVGPVLVR